MEDHIMAELGIIPAVLILSFVVTFAYSVVVAFRSTDEDLD